MASNEENNQPMDEDEQISRKVSNRVKLYHLKNDVWIDQGTGFVIGAIEEDEQQAFLIVENEQNSAEILLKSRVFGNTQYQKQQDTLIVWTDHSGIDIALSFEQPEGCGLVCDFLIQIQRLLEHHISLVAVLSNDDNTGGMAETICGPIEYPPDPLMDHNTLHVICQVLQNNIDSMLGCSEMCHFLESNPSFMTKLVDVFHQSETTHNLRNLHRCCTIIKTLISYNENMIFDALFDDSIFLDVIGMLEYDPEFPTYKSKFRHFLTSEKRFKEIVPLNDEKVKSLMISTFNFQFLKDVVLARLLDDPAVNSISTLIYFNQVEIISYLTENQDFLHRLFQLYQSSEKNSQDNSSKKEAVKLIHQFIVIAKSLQITQRSHFYKALLDKGLFDMINFALKSNSVEVRILGIELIVSVLENNTLFEEEKKTRVDELETVSKRRKLDEERYEPSQKTEQADDDNSPQISSKTLTVLLHILTDLLISESNFGLKSQAYQAIKSLLDPIKKPTAMEEVVPSLSTLSPAQIIYYFSDFYEEVASKLFAPLKVVEDTSHDDVLLLFLCEILTFCARFHGPLAKEFIIKNKLLQDVGRLQTLDVKKKVQLTSIRSIRSIIQLDDAAYTEEIVKNDLLKSCLQLLADTKGRTNLLYSTVVNLLDTIIVGNHEPDVSNSRALADQCYKHRNLLVDIAEFCNCGNAVIDIIEKSSQTPRDESDEEERSMLSKTDDTKEGEDEEEEVVQGINNSNIEQAAKHINRHLKTISKLNFNLSGKLSNSLGVIDEGIDREVSRSLFEDVFEEE